MEQVEMTSQQVEPSHVERWEGVIAALETKSATLAPKRAELESERRALLAERAAGNSTVEERLRELREELAEIERESEEIRFALPEAGRRLIEAKEARKAQAIAEMIAMVSVLETARKEKITRADKTRAYEDLLPAYVAHRQVFGLMTDLYGLTKNPRFGGHWTLRLFGDLEPHLTRVCSEFRQGMVPIPKPWGELFTIATTH